MIFTDHSDDQIKTLHSLPEVWRSEFNLTLSDVALDRFFTKDDTIRVSGYIGTRTKTTNQNKQIIETTPHRQQFQLAPTMYNKIGTKETALSFKGFLKQLEMLGVDINRMDKWGRSKEFTWMPPVNLDMLINYQNYFWTSNVSTDYPQYFTIQNKCTKSTYLVSAYENIIRQRGMQFELIKVDFASNSFVLAGDVVSYFKYDNVFYSNLSNNVNLDNKSWTIDTIHYDSTTDNTIIKPEEDIAYTNAIPLNPINLIVGAWWYNPTTGNVKEWTGTTWIEVLDGDPIVSQITVPAYFSLLGIDFRSNQFILNGKSDDIFVDGFVFFTKDSNYLLNKYWTTVSSTYDNKKDQTIVEILEPISSVSDEEPTSMSYGDLWFGKTSGILHQWNGDEWIQLSQSVHATVSMVEMLATYQLANNIACSTLDGGFGVGLWDDNNSSNVMWNLELMSKITHETLDSWSSANELEYLALWYKPTEDILYQYGDKTHPNPEDVSYAPTWTPIVGNFSVILNQTTGIKVFDYTPAPSQTYNEWSTSNKWIHKSAISSFNGNKRAQLPILEYDSNVELTELSEVVYSWMYRATTDEQFAFTTGSPSRLELEPIKHYVADQKDGIWYIYTFDNESHAVVDVNYTNVFTSNSLIRIVNSVGDNQIYTVDNSEFRAITPTDPIEVSGTRFVTAIRIKESEFNSPTNGGGVYHYQIIPTSTSLGNNWMGYHVHWCLAEEYNKKIPASSQKNNLLAELDAASETNHRIVRIKGESAYAGFMPQVSEVKFGNTYQEIAIDVDGITRIDLLPNFKYNQITPTNFASPSSGDVRVYINGMRQYGNYIERTFYSLPDYTRVDGVSTEGAYFANTQIHYVSGITFNTGVLKLGDVVRIEVGSATFDGMGLTSVPVRTIADDVLFDQAVSTGMQPTYRSLTPYKRVEQIKQEANQYPLFNIYNVLQGEVIDSSPIFTFKEDSTSGVDKNTNKRIIKLNNGTDFVFEQHLTNKDDGVLYCYRNKSKITNGTFWYNPNNSTIKNWDGNAWSSVVIFSIDGNMVARSIIVSSSDPVSAWDIDKALWFNPTSSLLYMRDVTSYSWNVHASVLVNGSDPTLQSIWRPSETTPDYIPSYVDKSGNSVEIGATNGDWEVLKQWKNNPEHSNRITIKLSDLYQHGDTILKNQKKISGLPVGGIFAYTQDEYNLNTGGTIKDFNYSFDSLISAINVTNINPIGLIEYAEKEHISNLYSLFHLFANNAQQIFVDSTRNNPQDFNNYVAASVISMYENNDAKAKLYGDSSTYDSNTKIGVRNWISTAAIFGLSPASKPNLSVDKGVVYLTHHDGHRSTIKYTTAEVDLIVRKLTRVTYPTTKIPLCKIKTTTPPYTISEYLSEYNNDVLLPGLCWYVVGDSSSFYRLELYQSTSRPPSLTKSILPDGIKYYNTKEQIVYTKQGLNWVADASAGDISTVWKNVNLAELVGGVYLEVENRLYDVAKTKKQKFDYASLITDADDQVVYDKNYRNRFDVYVSNHKIVSPFVNYQYSQTNPWTWNYQHSVSNSTFPRINVQQIENTSCWESLYSSWYNTPYPHLEPWKLQGYTNKPNWWDREYLDTTGQRKWKYAHSTETGMWENIKMGIVPVGCEYPSGVISSGNTTNDHQVLPRYNYFSVNISDDVVTGGYQPDDLLPPYYDNSSVLDGSVVRSLFDDYSQITAPDADYAFGSIGPSEWNWMVSSEYSYDKLIIAFTMQPVKWFHSAFGSTFTHIDSLNVDVEMEQVYSHKRTLFHGDMYKTNQIYKADGLNQWYVNYNRHTGYDTNNEFRETWVNWTPKLTYQFGGIVDSSSCSVSNPNYDLTNQDYNLLLVNNGVFNDMWLDVFNIKVVYIPPHKKSMNNEMMWKFDLSVLANIPRTIEYYGVKSYPFVVDIESGVCTAYKFKIIESSVESSRIYVTGDQTTTFAYGTTIQDELSNSYTVSNSTYESNLDRTRVNVNGPISDSLMQDHYVSLASFELPWTTGDMVIVSSSKTLPSPLVSNTQYFVVRDGDLGVNDFKLAESYIDSIANVSIQMNTIGSGTMHASEASSSFNVLGGDSHSTEVWYHYALDKSRKLTLSVPCNIKGIQNLINIIDGMSEIYSENGFITNSSDSNNFDYNTGRLITWDLEIERFIDWAYGLRAYSLEVNDRYDCVVNTSENTIQFVDNNPNWNVTQKVVFDSTGNLPTPLYKNTAYYLIPTSTSGIYKISLSSNILDVNMIVELIDSGNGQLRASTYKKSKSFAQFEINPHRTSVWLNTPTGLLSNVVDGPYSDIKVDQTIFDQYGRPLYSDNLFIYRQDKRSGINIKSNIANDVDTYYVNDPYNYIHIGGCHLFIESYEHFALFENYTVGGDLIYDPFIGVNISRIYLDFLKKSENTLRPTLGGYYLQGNEFKRNIEGSATDLKNCYDTSIGLDNSDMTKRARHLVGYNGDLNFLDTINVNSKSQFMFYKGMIATKGSHSSVQAFVNSRKFIDSSVDEFWAYKLTEFGDNRPKQYPEIKILSTDNVIDDVRFEFIGPSESVYNSDIAEAIGRGFIPVSFNDDTRWNNFPEQQYDLQSPLFLDAETTNITSVFVNSFAPPSSISTTFDFWYDNVNHVLHEWNGVNWDGIVYDRTNNTTTHVYWKHSGACDDVRVVREELPTNVTMINIIGIDTTNNYVSIPGNYSDVLYRGVLVNIINSTNNNSNDDPYHITAVSYDITNNVTHVNVNRRLNGEVVDGELVVRLMDFSTPVAVIMTPDVVGQSSYYKVNSECVRFPVEAFVQILHVYTINPSRHKTSPAKLVDVKSNTVVENIPLWHPAIGYHYSVAEHNIDLQHNGDPAKYTNTPSTSRISDNPWNETEVDKVWLDTLYLGYVPYSDDVIYPSVDDRLANWGKLAEFGDARVYRWTESTVPPSNWNTLVTSQSNDGNIQQNKKSSGMAKTSLFTTTRELYNGVLDLRDSQITLSNGNVNQYDAIVFSVNGNIPSGTQIATTYYVNTTGEGLTAFKIGDIVDNPIEFSPITQKIDVISLVVDSVEDDITSYADKLKHVLQCEAGFVTDGDTITFTSTGKLPGNIEADIEYIVTNVIDDVNTPKQNFEVSKVIDGVVALINIVLPEVDSKATENLRSDVYYYPTGKGTLYANKIKQSVIIAPAFTKDNLSNRPFIRQHAPICMLLGASSVGVTFPIVNEPLTWISNVGDPIWYNNENVDIYVNGKYVYSSKITVVNRTHTVILGNDNVQISMNESDIIDVVRSFNFIDLTFNPENYDDGSKYEWWVEDYEYTTVSLTNSNGVTSSLYYFWVEHSTNKPNGDDKLSVDSISSSIIEIPTAHFILQKPLDINNTDASKYGYDIPPYDDATGWSGGSNTINKYNELFAIAYREAIIRKIAHFVSSNDRYMVRFTHDLSLRDDIKANLQEMNLKNIHEQWVLFRKKQPYNIPRILWDKLTEAVAGVTLKTNTAVPNLTRVTYDFANGTETRFGLGDDQAFVDKKLGLATILQYLTDPTIDFSPIDIEEFLNTYNFDTADNIKKSMEVIYNTFGCVHVNAIWFSVLYDALSTKSRYKGLIKTSWISLNSVQPLDVNGIYSNE